jgi:hypothetical protein
MDAHHLVIDGQLRGGWRRRLTARAVQLEIDLFSPLSETERIAFDRAVAAYGRFLDRTVTVS